ncbi:MAG: energy transducer TonB [Acetobacteraceae bacterium]|nr:energy transducer TonB [Acetobacteraceae bacterium]
MNDGRLIVTVALSLGFHLAVALAIMLLPRAGAIKKDGAVPSATVELVMEEHKGDAQPPAPVPEAQPREARPQIESEAPSSQVPDRMDARPDEPAAPVPPVERAQSTPPPPPPVPIVTLRGTDSPSDAWARGSSIVPAAPDAVFHNRPPEYPVEALRSGQSGAVVLAIHISPTGQTAGVDVVRSSGYALLDRAAREAVMRWRFLPAVKDGRAVASDMTMQFVFDNQ